MKKLLLTFIVLLVVILSSCSPNKMSDYGYGANTDIKAESTNVLTSDLGIEYLKNNSQICAIISSHSNEHKIEEFDKNNKNYKTRLVLQSNLTEGDNTITIAQPQDSYVELDGINIVFLNEDSQEENIYMIVGGDSCIIRVNEGHLKTENPKLQKDINKKFNGRISNFYTWFNDNYNANQSTLESNISDVTTKEFIEEHNDKPPTTVVP